jgi:hypothetical protein
MKYLRGMKGTKAGAPVLTVEEYNADAEKLEAAINRAQPKNPSLTEQSAITKKLTGNTLLGTGSDNMSAQKYGAQGLTVVKCGLANLRQLAIGGAIFVNPTTWSMLLDIVEGDKGALFPLRTVNVPILGCVVATRGDSVTATLRNSSGLADLIEMSLSIGEKQQTPSPIRRTRFSSVVTIPIPLYTTHYTYAINGGVTLGDTQSQLDASGAILETSPAREGAFVPVNELATGVRYTVTAGLPRFVDWMFFTEK